MVVMKDTIDRSDIKSAVEVVHFFVQIDPLK